MMLACSSSPEESLCTTPAENDQTLQYMNQFDALYKHRLAEVENHADITETQRNELKFKVMSEWIKDLGEQNTLLVQTFQDLEVTTSDRVKLLQNKLQENANLVSRNMSYSQKSEEDLNALSNKVNDIKNYQDDMEEKIHYLENDICSLLTYIKRGRVENNWSVDGILFYTIQASEIPKVNDCTHVQIPTVTKKVRICTESCQEVIKENTETSDVSKQLEEYNHLLYLKDEEIKKLQMMLNEKSNGTINKKVEDSMRCNDSQVAETYFMNLYSELEEDFRIANNLKFTFEIVIKSLEKYENERKEIIAVADNLIRDLILDTDKYRSKVLELDQCKDVTKEFITTIENKIIQLQMLFQNKCEMCVKENLLSEVRDIILKVKNGIQTLSQMCENKNKEISSLRNVITKSRILCKKNTAKETEQKAMFDSIVQQFRMMEEFRICTVEVQAATEDLREEMSAVISNVNLHHCKYIEFTKMIIQVQDYITKTRENISKIINRLELQNEERDRHAERMSNNRIRLKDIKNEFNQTQLEVSKCLNNVQSNMQQTNLLGYAEIHTCNELLILVTEEVEQIDNNIHIFQTQGYCTLLTMTELRKQLTVMEHNIKDLKKKSDQVLVESDVAQKSFTERSKRLEKYECEVDNCHTKMQDILECIIATRDKMNDFGFIKETDNSFQSTNETIKMKDNLRKLHKECEELKLKITQESKTDKQDDRISEWENRVIDLQEQIQVLKIESKCKQDTINFLKQNVESLEKELCSYRIKFEVNCKRISENFFELKKKFFELENSSRVQKDVQNNLQCLTDNETDSKKLQLIDCVKDKLYESTLRQGLQGKQENIPQFLKVVQDNLQTIKDDLQELGDNLKRFVTTDSSDACFSSNSVKAFIEILPKYVENVRHSLFELEKMKSALYSKDKLMENMDKIIKIQKDSLTISQSEVEDLQKKLQEKIELQEIILQCENEKRELSKQMVLQVQTISHLQEAVVEAKRTIDQFNSKAASDVSEPWISASPTVFNQSNVHDI